MRRRVEMIPSRACDVQNGTGFPHFQPASVENRVCCKHVTVDVGPSHGDDVFDLEIWECRRRTNCQAGIVDEDIDLTKFRDGFLNC